MLRRCTIAIAAVAAATALSSPASAATIASTTTSLNIRSGPGPQFGVVGAIPERGQATIIGCLQDSMWCRVSYNGHQGWAYARYLTANLAGGSFIVAERLNEIPLVTYSAPAATVGSTVAAPAVTGEFVTRPAAVAPLALEPPPMVGTYVVSHPIAPVYLNGEVVEGVGLPETVALAPVPGYEYSYAYVNNVPVLVEPTSRQVVYIYR